jgi:sugar lactone lactonase YvrE
MNMLNRGAMYLAFLLLFGLSASAQSSIITTYVGPSLPANLTGSDQLDEPVGVAMDGVGNLFIADAGNHRVLKVRPDGTITTIAGTGMPGFEGDGGPASFARLNEPWGVAVDKAGSLFIADFENHRIRKVTPDGIIRTVAGNGTRGFSGDGGPATSAQLNGPSGIAADDAGNMFIADSLNDRVRKVTPDGGIHTIVSSAYVFNPDSVVVDAAGNLFIANPYPQNVLKVSPDGVITAAASGLHFPEGVAVDKFGNLFVADTGNHRVVKVTPEGSMSTLAGSSARGFGGDGGPASAAYLDSPFAVAVDGSGNLFIADSGNNRIRMVAAVIPPEPFTI